MLKVLSIEARIEAVSAIPVVSKLKPMIRKTNNVMLMVGMVVYVMYRI